MFNKIFVKVVLFQRKIIDTFKLLTNNQKYILIVSMSIGIVMTTIVEVILIL